ncbi:MAG: NERD domain-containing protein [Candidatus Muiribacteriota bacterium]
MAKMIPAVTDSIVYEGEREIALKLENDPDTKDWIVLHSLDIKGHRSQVTGECDFVVIIPGKGVLCIELKGCKSLKVSDGCWYYGTNPIGDTRGPFKQAADNMHSLRSYLVKASPDLKNIVFWSVVIFPYISFYETSPEWHNWQIVDSGKLKANTISRLLNGVIDNARSLLKSKNNCKWFNDKEEIPDKKHSENIKNVFRPKFEYYESPVSRRKRLFADIKKYTEEQYNALDAMQMNPRVVFNGPAGTGKTLLAVEFARRAIKKIKKLCLSALTKIFQYG